MMLHEFEARTGFYPTESFYQYIEKRYMESGMDKDEFCKAYKENVNGMAEAIAREVALKEARNEAEHKKKIQELQNQLADLRNRLDRELEWKPYDISRVPEDDYTELAKDAADGSCACAHYMTDSEAIDWICDEFDFDPSKVTIVHEIPKYEISRHRQLRETDVLDRRPVYYATDYYYICFRTKHQSFEAWNGELYSLAN